MYKALPITWILFPIIWLTIGFFLILQAINGLAHTDFSPTLIPGVVWLFVNLIFLKCVWRWIWEKIPFLNTFIFPDLNGTWEVKMDSNWPRQQQLLEAAAGTIPPFDMKTCDENLLRPILSTPLEATISQNWLKIEMVIHNPAQNSPIEKSDMISASPFRADGLSNPGLFYFFEQTNRGANISDSNKFYGAARVEYFPELKQLRGRFWTARMWERAMNTAGEITFTRVSKKVKKKHKLLK